MARARKAAMSVCTVPATRPINSITTSKLKCLASPPPKIRWVIFVVLALIALAVRLPKLGARPMHTDESINAYIIGQLLAGQPFRYDPQDRHGPALAAVTLPLVKLEGAGDFATLTESEQIGR